MGRPPLYCTESARVPKCVVERQPLEEIYECIVSIGTDGQMQLTLVGGYDRQTEVEGGEVMMF